MARRKPFLLRDDAEHLDSLQRWANDELRSLNGHIEFLLRRELQAAGRARKPRPPDVGQAALPMAAGGDDDPPQADGWG